MLKVEVNLLQTPSIRVEGVEVTLPLRRSEALLYYMICNRSASRKELVDLIWEDCDFDAGHKNLRNAMYILKKSMNANVLLTPQKTTVLLNQGIVIDCDYIRFMEQGDFDAYRGQFLGGFYIKGADCFDRWVEQTREKIREQYLNYCSQLVLGASEKGAIARAAHFAIEYLRKEPSDEKMSTYLMELYRTGSMYQKAAEVYSRLKMYLDEELGINPLSETTQLYYEILNEWNVAAQDTKKLGALFPPWARLHDSLHNVFLQFEKGSGVVRTHLHLSGEAGSGKTFLLEGVIGNVRFKKTRIFRGTCFESSTGRPYHAWQSIIMDVVQCTKESGNQLSDQIIARLSKSFPSLAGYAANVGECDHSEDISSDFLYILHLALRQQKMIIVIENVQWMDTPGAALLDAVARRFHAGQLMLVTVGQSFVPEYMEDYLRSAVDDRLLRLELIPSLTYDDVYMLVQEQYGSETARLTTGSIMEETIGNLSMVNSILYPHISETVVDALLWRSRTLLKKRVERLSACGRSLLRVLSFFPKGAPYGILKSVCEIELKYLAVACDELKHHGFACEALCDSQDVLKIIYENTRRLIYIEDTTPVRQATHEKIAHAIRVQSMPPTAEMYAQLEYHLIKSGDHLSALVCQSDRLFMFVSKCFRNLPFLQTPESELRQSLSVHRLELETIIAVTQQMTSPPDCAKDFHIQIATLDAAMTLLAGFSVEALEKATQAVPFSNDKAMFLLVHFFTEYSRQSIYTETSCALADACQKLSENSVQNSAKVFLQWLRGRLLLLDGEYELAEDCLQNALDLVEESRLIKAGILHAKGMAYLRQKEYEKSWEFFSRAIEGLGGIPPIEGLYALYLDSALSAMFLKDYKTAQNMAQHAASIAVKAYDYTGIVASCVHLAILSAESFPEAIQFLSRAIEHAEQASSNYEQGLVCYARAGLRRAFEQKGQYLDSPLTREISQPFQVYCRKGIMLLSSVKDTLEQEELRGYLTLMQ
ncbi:MAG: AAA family ATPase [Oscillospiraceae bacterium]|nr:AAA family ATPase [Oscillospiraceae bacterium]